MHTRLAFAATAVAFALTLTSAAWAQNDPQDCPPGSVWKTEEGKSFCQATVCENDAMCLPNEVCRPMPLCVQLGVLSGDGGAVAANKESRLVATGRCVEGKCPSTTTCKEASRCIDKQKADKLGLLTAPAASASASPSDAKKSACGCSVVGTRTESSAGLLIAVGAIAIAAARRRRAKR